MGYGVDGKSWNFDLGRRLLKKTGDNKSRNYLVQRISMATRRVNAACTTPAMPPEGDLQHVFYVIYRFIYPIILV